MQAPDYESLMKKYDIHSLMGGSDLALIPGTIGIQLDRRGSIMWQGKAHHAMFLFTNSYISNWQKLHQLYDEVIVSYREEQENINAQNARADEYTMNLLNKQPVDRKKMHTLNSKHNGILTSREINSGSIFVVLNTLLDELKKDLGIDINKFANSSPFFKEQSFGKVIWAASNNFRHAEEWRAQWVSIKSFSDQQLKSVKVLATVLDFENDDYRFLARNVCPDILMVLSSGSFETLEQYLFSFANNLAEGVENKKNTGEPLPLQ